jgi:hypothetical protein
MCPWRDFLNKRNSLSDDTLTKKRIMYCKKTRLGHVMTNNSLRRQDRFAQRIVKLGLHNPCKHLGAPRAGNGVRRCAAHRAPCNQLSPQPR